MTMNSSTYNSLTTAGFKPEQALQVRKTMVTQEKGIKKGPTCSHFDSFEQSKPNGRKAKTGVQENKSGLQKSQTWSKRQSID